jgi:hypothetical protein
VLALGPELDGAGEPVEELVPLPAPCGVPLVDELLHALSTSMPTTPDTITDMTPVRNVLIE